MADWSFIGGAPPQVLPQGSLGGTDVVSSGSTNTKGSWVEIEDVTLEEYTGFWLTLFDTATGQKAFLVDIGIGAAAAEQVVLENVFWGSGHATASTGSITVYCPLRVPKGVRVAARAQCSTASATIRVSLHGQPPHAYFPVGFGRCTTYGADTATSSGTQVDPGTSANTKGAWTVLSSSTTNRIRALTLDVQVDNHTGENYVFVLDVGVGAASSEVVLIPNLPTKQVQTGEFNTPGTFGPFYLNIPAGTRLAVRLACSATGSPARLLDVVAHGFD